VDQTPARGGAALTNARHRGVPVVLEKRLRGSIGSRRKPRVELGVDATGSGNGGSVPGVMRAATSLTPFVGARALRRGSRPSTVWALRGSGEARRPIAVQGRRGAHTATSRLGGRRGVRGRVAHGKRTRMAVRQGQRRCMDQGSEACLGVRAQHGRGAAGRDTGATARSGRQRPKTNQTSTV
jgi:hypothetical protein